VVLGAAQGLRNELRQNAIRFVLEKLTPIEVKHLARHSLQDDEPLWEDVMADALHIVCPHCDASNRVPRERLRDGAKCGPAIGRRLSSPEFHPKSDDCRNIAGVALFGPTEKIPKNLAIVNWSRARARQDRPTDSKSHDSRGAIEQKPHHSRHERGKIRYSDFINQKVYDLLLRAEATAKANGRGIIEPFDLPITKGLQGSIHEFQEIDEQIELHPILDQLTARPPLDLAYDQDTESQLPEIVGGLSVALARTFKIIDGNLKNPATEHWQKCIRIFDLLM
jgi:hypothetical protein